MFGGKARHILADYVGLSVVLALMILFFSVTTSHFFSGIMLKTIANQIPDATIIAVGMTFVLIIAGIDLSVGSVLALGSAILGVLLKNDWPLAAGVGGCLAAGLACGLVNGGMVIGWRLPSFIITLGMLEVARGLAYLVTDSKTQYIGGRIAPLLAVNVGGFSLAFFIAVAVVIAGQILLTYTRFGRYALAVGANEETARLSGIPVNAVKLAVFALCGLLAAMAALFNCARMESADPNAGAGYELQAIAAVVIGGTSLMGGRGSIVNTFFGVIIIVVLENGLVQIGADEPVKRVVTGAVIVVAVVVDYYRNRLRARA